MLGWVPSGAERRRVIVSSPCLTLDARVSVKCDGITGPIGSSEGEDRMGHPPGSVACPDGRR